MIPSDALAKIAAYLGTPSTISDHGKHCCRAALAWLHGVDVSSSYRDARWHPPTWLRRTYGWGCVSWPLYWCSVPEMEELDCGALAAVAVELYRMRALPVTPVQLALRYPSHATEQWSQMWKRDGQSASWITEEFVYHEACGVIEGSGMLLWDPTENRWLDPPFSANETFASVAALKVPESASDTLVQLHWGGVFFRCGAWQALLFDDEGRLTSDAVDGASRRS